MEESILKSTKKILGLDDTYTAFDLDVITHINSAFSILDQLGVGPDGGFFIEDLRDEWSDYPVPPNQLNLIKTYIFLEFVFSSILQQLRFLSKPQIINSKNMNGELVHSENGCLTQQIQWLKRSRHYDTKCRRIYRARRR